MAAITDCAGGPRCTRFESTGAGSGVSQLPTRFIADTPLPGLSAQADGKRLMHSIAKTLLLSLVLTVSPLLAAAQDDAGEIKQVEARWQEAWNRHDMDALAGLFTRDADFVQVNGRRWVGTEEIRRNHAAVHAMMFKDSVWKNIP